MKKTVSWNKRKRWILIFYATIVVSIIFIITLFNFNNIKKSVRDETDAAQLLLLSQISQNIDLRLSYIDSYLEELEKRPEVTAFFGNPPSQTQTPSADAIFGEITLSDPAVESVYLYETATDFVFANDTMRHIGEFYDTGWQEYLSVLNEKRIAWTLPRTYFSDGQNTSVVSLLRTYPLITTPDNIQGYIIVNLNANMLNQITQSSVKNTTASFLILTMDNDVLFQSQNYYSYDKQDIKDGISKGKQNFRINEKNSTPLSVHYTTFGKTNWRIAVVAPYTEILSKINFFRNYNIFVGASIALFMIMVILLSNKVMYAPIDNFIELVSRHVAAAGNDKPRSFEELENMFMYMYTQQKRLSEQLDINIPFLKYQLLHDLLSNDLRSYELAKARFSLLKMQLYPSNYIVMLIDLNNKDLIWGSSDESGVDVYISSIYNKAEELINQEDFGMATQMPNKLCAALISFETDDQRANSMKAIEIAEALCRFMKDCYDVTITVAIGNYYTAFTDIPSSYNDAMYLMQYKSVIGQGGIITSDDIHIQSSYDVDNIKAEIAKLTRAIESRDFEQVRTIVDSIFIMITEAQLPSELLYKLSMLIVHNCLELYTDISGENAGLHYSNIEFSIMQIETANEIKQFLLPIIKEIMEEIGKDKAKKGSDELILKIVEYVDKSYSNSGLSLALLADKFKLSVPYLSRIFKSHTKKTFTDYLIELRMEKAAHMLLHTDRKVNEISELVGYPNPSSFIRIFKKFYFMTPVDYRHNKNDL